jgi:tripartite-type tricarboxylate transporter receptor subunit TctC
MLFIQGNKSYLMRIRYEFPDGGCVARFGGCAAKGAMAVTGRLAWLFATAFATTFAGGDADARAISADHPINFIVPWGLGGGAHLLARTAGKFMSRDLGVSLPAINVPGAADQTGMSKLVNAPADGYSLTVPVGDADALLAGPRPSFATDQVIPPAMIQQPSGCRIIPNSKWFGATQSRWTFG